MVLNRSCISQNKFTIGIPVSGTGNHCVLQALRTFVPSKHNGFLLTQLLSSASRSSIWNYSPGRHICRHTEDDMHPKALSTSLTCLRLSCTEITNTQLLHSRVLQLMRHETFSSIFYLNNDSHENCWFSGQQNFPSSPFHFFISHLTAMSTTVVYCSPALPFRLRVCNFSMTDSLENFHALQVSFIVVLHKTGWGSHQKLKWMILRGLIVLFRLEYDLLVQYVQATCHHVMKEWGIIGKRPLPLPFSDCL